MSTVTPIGVQRKRTKGYRMPIDTISVARPGTWGNPHKFGTEEDCKNAETAVIRFEHDLILRNLKDRSGMALLDRIGELRNKNLACFCPIGSPCHRDVLLKYANLGN